MEHKTYQKINTLYKRYADGDLKNCIILGDYSDSAVEYLKDCLWLCYEKIDGTNMSYYWDGHTMDIHGKTDAAQIPAPLKSEMERLVTAEMLSLIFPITYDGNGVERPLNVRIYGEGYGGQIQCGRRYRADGGYSFRIFDIEVNGWWLEHEAVDYISKKMGLETCPFIGEMTIPEAEQLVINGFKSRIADDETLLAEGLVCRPKVSLFDRQGKRVIVKIKTCDYEKLKNKGGL